jgi:hypothetical protein
MSLFGIVVVTAIGVVIMLLWNALLPEIFGFKTIGFWQALGLFILTRILFWGFWGGKPHGRQFPDLREGNSIRKRWMEMSEEERKEFIKRRRDLFRGGPFSRRDYFDRETDPTDTNETTRDNK